MFLFSSAPHIASATSAFLKSEALECRLPGCAGQSWATSSPQGSTGTAGQVFHHVSRPHHPLPPARHHYPSSLGPLLVVSFTRWVSVVGVACWYGWLNTSFWLSPVFASSPLPAGRGLRVLSPPWLPFPLLRQIRSADICFVSSRNMLTSHICVLLSLTTILVLGGRGVCCIYSYSYLIGILFLMS